MSSHFSRFRRRLRSRCRAELVEPGASSGSGLVARPGGRTLWLAAVVLIICPPAVWGHPTPSGSPNPIPEEVLASAREYVISKVGETFFDSYITWRPELSGFKPLVRSDNALRLNRPDWLRSPRYVIVYRLRIPEKPFVDETVVVNIRADGGWFEDTAYDEGLPDCVSHPEECEFPIDEQGALEIAGNAGLEPGRKPWEADFRWFGREHKTYAWEVRNELAEGFGEVVLIDANDGTVIEKGEWRDVVWGHPPMAP